MEEQPIFVITFLSETYVVRADDRNHAISIFLSANKKDSQAYESCRMLFQKEYEAGRTSVIEATEIEGN